MKTIYFLWKNLAFGQKRINNQNGMESFPFFFFFVFKQERSFSCGLVLQCLLGDAAEHLCVTPTGRQLWGNTADTALVGGHRGEGQQKSPWGTSVTLGNVSKRNQLGRRLIAFCDNSKLSLERGEKWPKYL